MYQHAAGTGGLRIQRVEDIHIGLNAMGKLLLFPQQGNPLSPFLLQLGTCIPQVILALARMTIQDKEGFVFLF